MFTPRSGSAGVAVFVVAFAALLGACGDSGEIGIEDPWARPTAPNADSAAFYVTFENNSGEDDLLIDGYSPACGTIEIHRTDMVDDVMTMSRATVADLSVGNGDSLVMEPGGLHVMCLDLLEPFVEGETASLELTFDKTGVLTFDVPIEQR